MTANARRLSTAALYQLVVPSEPWLSCEDCFEQMDAYVDARLADPSFPARAMDVHLGACPACAEEAVSLTVLVAQAYDVDPDAALRGIRSQP